MLKTTTTNFQSSGNYTELSVEHLINAVSAICAGYGIPHKLMSDAGTNFVSENFRCFYRSTNVEQAVSLAYHQQSNR